MPRPLYIADNDPLYVKSLPKHEKPERERERERESLPTDPFDFCPTSHLGKYLYKQAAMATTQEKFTATKNLAATSTGEAEGVQGIAEGGRCCPRSQCDARTS